MVRNKRAKLYLKNYSRELMIVAALIFMVSVFTIINPSFINWGNIKDIIDMSTIYGLMALGMSFAIISGGIDLSAGASMALMGIILAKMVNAGISPLICLPVTILCGGFFGAINGFLIAKMKIQPFIATLATQNIFRGAAFLLTNGYPVTGISSDFRNLIYGEVFSGIRISSFIFIFAAIAATILLKYTKFGNYVYAVGGNIEAARLSGVKCVKTKIMAFVVCGLCEALAAIVLVAKIGTAECTAAQSYEQQAIAAVAIGGASMAGGRGTIMGAFLGAILLNCLRNGLIVVGVGTYWQYVATGLVMIIAVSTELLQGRKKKQSKN
ncbi:MAG: ABC transporter permease [Oscillospiraceae bacterium]